MTLALDLDLDVNIVAARAAEHLGADAAIRLLDAPDSGCCRAAASNRLFLRRHSAGPPPPGEGFSYLDHLHLIDAELARMGASPEGAAGCGRFDCPICFNSGDVSMTMFPNPTDPELATIADRYYQALGHAAEKVAAEVEELARGPVDLDRLLGLLGKLAILTRIFDGGLVSADLIRFFFAPEPALLAAPLPAFDGAEFAAALERIVSHLKARYGATLDTETTPSA